MYLLSAIYALCSAFTYSHKSSLLNYSDDLNLIENPGVNRPASTGATELPVE